MCKTFLWCLYNPFLAVAGSDALKIFLGFSLLFAGFILITGTILVNEYWNYGHKQLCWICCEGILQWTTSKQFLHFRQPSWGLNNCILWLSVPLFPYFTVSYLSSPCFFCLLLRVLHFTRSFLLMFLHLLLLIVVLFTNKKVKTNCNIIINPEGWKVPGQQQDCWNQM